MKPINVSYQLVPVAESANDAPSPALNSITFHMESTDGKLLNFRLERVVKQPVTLTFKGGETITVDLKNIVCIESGKDLSNNKKVYFTDRPAGILVDFTAKRDIAEKLHIPADALLEVCYGFHVNKLYINDFDGKNVLVEVFKEPKKHKIPVSRQHKKEVLQLIRENGLKYI